MTQTEGQTREVQLALLAKGHDLGPAGADGDYGPTTHRANMAAIMASAMVTKARTGLANPAAFWTALRNSAQLGPTLSVSEVDGVQNKLDAMGAAGWGAGWVGYGLGTSYHETAATMQPIREYGRGAGKKYGKPGPHGGQVAYGRGDVQLTWPENYARADKELGLGGALLANYDKAMEPAISAQIMVRGMEQGWFTGRTLGHYLPRTGVGDRATFKAMRPIINGTDKADLIARHALVFQSAAQAGGWGPLPV